MARFNAAPGPDEYSILNLTCTAVAPNGQRWKFMFQQGDGSRVGTLEDAMYDNKPESKTVQGSGSNPRAHLGIVNKPTCELTMGLDTATGFEKFVKRNGGKVDVVFTRKVSSATAVTDVARAWQPLFGGATFKSGDAALPKVTGNCLRIDKDVRDAIA